MKKVLALLTGVAVFAICSTSHATITDAEWYNDPDGNLICQSWTFTGGDTLNMWGHQYSSGPDGPAHMLGYVETDTPLDPKLTLGSAVNNDSTIAWLGYQVNVIMSVPFSFAGPVAPWADNPGISDWYKANEVAPTLQASGPWAGQYMGSLYFNAGTPVGIGGELDFGYTILFEGSTHYAFTQESFAYLTLVPEPSALALLGLGGLMLAARRRRSGTK